MEILWIIVIVGFFIWKISQGAKQDEKINSIPDLTLDLKEEKEILQGREMNVFTVYVKGWVNSKRDHTVSGKISLSLIDKTEEKGSIVLTNRAAFGEELYPHIFNILDEMEFTPGSYFPDYTPLFKVPIDVLTFPYRGIRNIEAKVIYGSNKMQISGGGLEDVNTAIGFATTQLKFEVKSIGYKEFEQNALDFEESSIKLAMITAAIDGSLDQVELDVIKDWCHKRSYFVSEEKQIEEKKQNLSKLIQKTYKQAKEQKLTMTKIMSKIKKDLVLEQRYQAVELMLDVMAADSVLDEKENDLIERTVKSLDLDYKVFKAMRDTRLSKLSKINVADGSDEKIFGLDDKMTKEEKCKELRKQYTKWSGLTASSDKTKRDQAEKMVEKISKLRQSLGC